MQRTGRGVRRPAAVAALLAALASCSGGLPDTSEMNILLITLEDCTTRAIGCYGSEVAKTPHIDAFAATAVRFDRAYCQYPACNPSRASFVTGMRPLTTRVLSNDVHMEQLLPDGIVTLPEVLEQDWFLVAAGKLFHRSPRQLAAFDRVLEWPAYDPDATPAKAPPAKAPPRKAAEPGAVAVPGGNRAQAERQRLHSDRFGVSPTPENHQKDHQVFQAAARILANLKKVEKRFFLSIGSKLPHTPLLPPQRFHDLYRPEEFELPPKWDTPRPGYNPDIFTRRYPSEEEARACIQAYHASVSFVDEKIGEVLRALEAAELADSTIVILMADHGFRLGTEGYWGKYTLFEEVTRVPFLVRVPGNPANGSVCDEIVELVDLLPTICELGSMPEPEGLEGISMVPLLESPQRPWKRAAFTLGYSARDRVFLRSMRTRRYRYTEWTNKDRSPGRELFDLESDPWELENVAEDAERAEMVAELAALLKADWRGALPPVE